MEKWDFGCDFCPLKFGIWEEQGVPLAMPIFSAFKGAARFACFGSWASISMITRSMIDWILES